MGRRLTDIRPGHGSVGGEGVSLVYRGANRRQFLLAKADEVDQDIAGILAEPAAREGQLLDAVRKAGGDETVEKAAAALARATEALHDAFAAGGMPAEVRKAMNDLADDADDTDGQDDEDGDELDELAKGYELLLKEDAPTDEQRQQWAKEGIAMPDGSYYIRNRTDLGHAIRAVGRGRNNSHQAIRAHIVRRAKALGATSQLPDDWNVQKEDRMPETAVPVKKEDGTYDLSAVPEDARATVEAILKARDDSEAELVELRKSADEQKTKADEAIAIAKAERDQRETREFVAKSAALDQLAKSDDEFGEVLKSIAAAERDGHLPDGTAGKLDEVLKAANEQVSKGALFSEIGRAGAAGRGATDADSKLDQAAAELRKADTSLTVEQAVAKALDNDPSLYDEYRKEQV